MFKPLSIPLITTWTLWRQLWPPSTHPLFKHRLKPPAPRRFVLPSSCLALLLFGGMACCSITSLAFFTWEAPIPVILPLAIFLVSTLSVGLWALNTSALIAQERARQTYDLVCLAPSGSLGVHWALCSVSLRGNDSLIWIHAVRMLGTEGLLFILIVSLTDPGPDFLAQIAILAAASFLDHIQATVLGCLVGMSVPAFVHSPASARLWAGLFFGALQWGTLLVTGLILLGLARLVPEGLAVSAVGALIFLLLREGVVIGLWRALAHQLNTDPTRIDLALG